MKTFVYRRSKILRRLGSVFLDAIICLFVFVFFFVLINEPIVKKSSAYQEVANEYQQLHVDSGLYIRNDDGIVVITDNYNEKLTYFYEKYDSIDTYNNFKKESNLFNYDEVSNTYVEVGTKEEMTAFYVETLYKAYNILIETDEYKELNGKLEIYSMLMVLPSFSVALICTFLLPCFFLKGRRTIGMIPFHLSFVSSKSGQTAEKMQIVCRFLLFFFLEYVLFLVSGVGILVAIASTFVIFVTPRRTSLLDLATQVIVIDDFPQGEAHKEDEIIIALDKENENGEE